MMRIMVETTLPRIERGTLAEKATGALLEFIRSHHMQPGSMLPPEARLAELLGVSRPVVREALRGLRGLGVISVLNGRGAVVRELDSSTLEVFFAHALQTIDNSARDLMELRRAIEGQTAMLAAERRSEEQAATIAGLVEGMRAELDNPAVYSKLDAQFHVAIAVASGNVLFHHFVHSIQSALEDVSLRGLRRRTERRSLQQVQQLHERIADSIVRKKPAEAAIAMNEHMTAATKVLLGT
jgi:GntR family transcriptional regulator, transcriptional repressor for pyruvate dehydrogenase complex